MSDKKEDKKLVCEHTDLPAIKCWACGEILTLHSRAENDGFCHYCGSEIELVKST